MELLEKARVMTYHRRRLGSSDHVELGWRSRANQRMRFEALCRWGNMSGSSVMDLGCGHGDLKPFLDERFENVRYLGIDFLPEFVLEAIRRHGNLPGTHFLQADFMNTGLPEVDLVVACGSLNYKTENVLFAYSAISRMWEAASRGVAFNMLDDRLLGDDSILAGYDPDEILSFCRNLDPEAEIVRDYSPEDFTILMRK